MPKRSPSKRTRKAKGRPTKEKKVKKVPRRLDIDSVEEDTMKRVGHTLKIIEGFLAKWDAAKARPEDLLPQIMKIRKFHDALQTWQRDAVRTRGKEDDDARMRRLRDFVLICQTYS